MGLEFWFGSIAGLLGAGAVGVLGAVGGVLGAAVYVFGAVDGARWWCAVVASGGGERWWRALVARGGGERWWRALMILPKMRWWCRWWFP